MKRDSFWFSKELYVRIEKESGGCVMCHKEVHRAKK